MTRVFNFSAGPSAVPEHVLQEIREDLFDYRRTGMSVMEMSHRSDVFIEIAAKAEQSLRLLLNVDDEYEVLFLQGGATLQFSMIPLNLSESREVVEYVDTGAWSRKAIAEAEHLRDVHVVASSHISIPAQETWDRHEDSRYLHFTSNETITGLQFQEFPQNLEVPVVADMSSDFLTRPLNVKDFGLIYAGAQKNAGIAGLAIVIVRKDLIATRREGLSDFLGYRAHADKDSMFNTPNTFAWYVAGLTFDWVLKSGGVGAMQCQSQRRSTRIYDVIDSSDVYSSVIDPPYRSSVNVTFTIEREDLQESFLAEAEVRNIVNLKGHRSVGGYRASLYNGVTDEAVDALVDHMTNFEKEFA